MSNDSQYVYTVTQTHPADDTNKEASVTVLVTDRVKVTPEGHTLIPTPINGTEFTFKPRSYQVTNTFSYGNTDYKKTFVLFNSEPQERRGGADGLLDGGMHSGTAASRWITDSATVLKFVQDFVNEHQAELNNLISASRGWAKDNSEKLQRAHQVTGISVLSENVQTAFLTSLQVQSDLADSLVTKYVSSVRPELNDLSD
jgi:hypothetical protein